MLDIYQGITASIPADAQTEEDITDAILTAVHPGLKKLFETEDIYIKDRKMALAQYIGRNEQATIQIINSYVQWTPDNRVTSISLGEGQHRLEKQRYIHEQHIAKNKWRDLIKKARLSIVNGVYPYIDRILSKVYRLVYSGYIYDEIIKNVRYQHIDEFVTTINEYNDILALQIRIKQDTLSLNIETLELNELFELLRKENQAFEIKQLDLVVGPTDVCAKTSKVLTLFMINALAESAHKYTPKGGTVEIYARKENDYVEMSVEDNGHGLSPEDIAHTIGEKICDSKVIDMNNALNQEELRKEKDSGFGLVGCRSIIRKYKKTNPIFDICSLNVEDALRKGSYFYFGLPVDVCKIITAVLLMFSLSTVSCNRTANNDMSQETPIDSLVSTSQEEYKFLLDQASDYTNDAYYCNIEDGYIMALQYIDSATICLNEHCRKYIERPHCYTTLAGNDMLVELDQWGKMFNPDSYVILDLRNEAAVTFFTLKQWGNYNYNNSACTALYKLLGEDQFLEYFCRELERSINSKMVSILLVAILLIASRLGYYVLYFHRRLVSRWNLR